MLLSRKIGVLADTARDSYRALGRQKIFCIGQNKTGTTSLAAALRNLDIPVGQQRWAERLLPDWGRRDFRRIVWYCRTAQAFQDIPFSLPYTFQAMDMYFPGSKFILTVRDDPEQWYRSLISFLIKRFGSEAIASQAALREVSYRYRGFIADVQSLSLGPSEEAPYNKDVLIAYYNFHNKMVADYFRNRPEDLLVLNVAEQGAHRKLCEFLHVPCHSEDFPWENKT